MPGGGADDLAGLDAMGNMFQSMVKQLLSKELLYQPLNEVASKYKEYLSANESTLASDQLDKYKRQSEIVDSVLQHLDGDSEHHSLEEKNQRFEVLLDLLQRMHDLGQPPKEVVGEGNSVMPNLAGLPGLGQMPGLGDGQDPSQCSLM